MIYNYYATYQDDVIDLAQVTYEFAKLNVKGFIAETSPPNWFLEIIENNIKGYLNIIFTAKNNWVIFPEILPTLSAIVYKKPKGSVTDIPPVEIIMKYFGNADFFENSTLILKIVKRIVLDYLKELKKDDPTVDMVILENEDIKVYIFKKTDLVQNLVKMGFAKNEIEKFEDQIQEEYDLDAILSQLYGE